MNGHLPTSPPLPRAVGGVGERASDFAGAGDGDGGIFGSFCSPPPGTGASSASSE